MVINPFTEIKKDLLKISYASFLLELTSQVLKQTNEKDIFELLEETLLKIEDGYDPIIITNILELKYLDYLGIKPVLDSCAVCRKILVLLQFLLVRVDLYVQTVIQMKKLVDKKTINVLRKLYHVDISKISKIKLSNNTRKEIDDFINEYYDRYSGLYLKSKNFLKSIKNVYI